MMNALNGAEDQNQRSFTGSLLLGSFMKELVKEPLGIKVICPSRFAPGPKNAFLHCNHRIFLQQQNVPDIKHVITNGVASLLGFLHADDEDEEQFTFWSKAPKPTNLYNRFSPKTRPWLTSATAFPQSEDRVRKRITTYRGIPPSKCLVYGEARSSFCLYSPNKPPSFKSTSELHVPMVGRTQSQVCYSCHLLDSLLRRCRKYTTTSLRFCRLLCSPLFANV